MQTGVLFNGMPGQRTQVLVSSVRKQASEYAIATRHKILKSNPLQSQSTVVHLDPDLPKHKLTRLTAGLTEEVYSNVHQIPFFSLSTNAPFYLVLQDLIFPATDSTRARRAIDQKQTYAERRHCSDRSSSLRKQCYTCDVVS